MDTLAAVLDVDPRAESDALELPGMVSIESAIVGTCVLDDVFVDGGASE